MFGLSGTHLCFVRIDPVAAARKCFLTADDFRWVHRVARETTPATLPGRGVWTRAVMVMVD